MAGGGPADAFYQNEISRNGPEVRLWEASYRRRSIAFSSPRTASLPNSRVVGYPETTSAPWGQSEGDTQGTRNQSVFQLNETNSKRRLKAGGVGILSLTENVQLIDFIKREKR